MVGRYVVALVGLVTVLFTSTVQRYRDPHCSGNRQAIVHLYEWKWNDIASECARFLGPYGFCGVQISPPTENRVVTSPNRPWWERYEPVSYKLSTRGGNEDEFEAMVQTCNDVGVRIFVDVVINNMAGAGHQGYSTGGSYFDTDNLEFPEVPYGPSDFNNESNCRPFEGISIEFRTPEAIRNCRLEKLLDLNQGKEEVRSIIVKYLDHLIDLGVAGFRMDSVKFMWPEDIAAILERVKDVHQGGRPFVYQAIIDKDGSDIKVEEYLETGRITNYKFGMEVARLFRGQNPLKYLTNWGTGWGMLDSGDVVNFVDSHYNQRGNSHGSVLTHWESRPYKLATAFMLAHPYGVPRIMSSYEFNHANNWEGPPHNDDMSIKEVKVNGMLCEGGWTCEHRWRQIYNMVAFRNMAAGTGVDNWWSGADFQIAFSRGDKAFIAFNLENWDLSATLQTGLPAGTYCDIITGNLENDQCTGSNVTVQDDGMAWIFISTFIYEPMMAIHVGAKVNGTERRY